jgi:hypothetical protein
MMTDSIEQNRAEAKAKAIRTYNDNDKVVSMIEANEGFRDRGRATASHVSLRDLLVTLSSSPYQGQSTAYHELIRECLEVYYSTPVVRNIIDLMTDFCAEGFKIIHKDPSVQKFYDSWAKKSGFYSFVRRVFHNVILTGNVFIMKQYGKISKPDQKELTKGYWWEPAVPKKYLPVNYIMLNPMRVWQDSNEIFNDRKTYFRLSQRDVMRIRDPIEKTDVGFIKALPDDFKNNVVGQGRIPIPADRLTTLFYKKLDWQDWAFPLIFSAIDDINYKKLLRQMDEASANDVIKAIVIFKLGKLQEGMGPDANKLAKFSALLKQPSGAKNIVWDDLIEVVDSFPPIEQILGEGKYKVVDRDILSNFGVSELLITGDGGNFSSGFLSVRGLLEKLKSVRNEVVERFIQPELDFIHDSFDFDTRAMYRFSTMSLRDEAAEQKLLIELMDRKVLSPATVIEEMEYDTEIEAIKNERASKVYPDVLSPYDPKDTGTLPGGGGKIPSKKPGGGKPGQGRPSNTKKIPQTKKRNTKPKGMSSRLYKFMVEKLVGEDNMITAEINNKANTYMLLALENIPEDCENLTDEIVEAALSSTTGTIYEEYADQLDYLDLYQVIEES